MRSSGSFAVTQVGVGVSGLHGGSGTQKNEESEVVRNRRLSVEMKVKKDPRRSLSFFCGVLKTRPTKMGLLE